VDYRLQVTILACAVALGVAEGSGGDAKKTPPTSPELKPLEAMVGTWKVEVTARPTVGGSDKREVIETFEWFLGGQFLRGKATVKDRSESHFIVQYDRVRKKYRFWYFDSTGHTGEMTGEWNDASRRMTWSENGDLLKTTIKVHFVNAEQATSITTVSSKTGAVLYEEEGDARRCK
jgi:hypothetical protein